MKHTKKQIVIETLERHLEQGPGHRVPAEEVLARTLKTSRGTVRSVLMDFQAKGRLLRHPARGTFVAPPVKNRMVLVVMDQNANIDQVAAAPIANRFAMVFMKAIHASADHFFGVFMNSIQFQEELPLIRQHYPNLVAVVFAYSLWALRREVEARAIHSLNVPVIYVGPEGIVEPQGLPLSEILVQEEPMLHGVLRATKVPGSIGIWGPTAGIVVGYRRQWLCKVLAEQGIKVVDLLGHRPGQYHAHLHVDRIVTKAMSTLNPGSPLVFLNEVAFLSGASLLIRPEEDRPLLAYGSPDACRLVHRKVTVFSPPLEAMSHEALAMIQDRLAGGKPRRSLFPLETFTLK